MTPLEILKAARALITDPQHWTTGDYARDVEGHGVGSGSPDAVAWCAFGAISAVGRDASRRHRDSADEALRLACGGLVGDANDRYGHAYILAAYDRAIAKLEGSPQ